jgi:ATP-dependent exoDNAse (exonuclease V) beta subunit
LETARDLIRRSLASDLTRQLASATQLWREVSFALPWRVPGRNGEPELIGGQIDCCFVSKDGTLQLIDYKTGDYTRAASPADILAPYRLQLGLYALAAEDWWGRAPDALHLVIFRPEVRLVTWTFDADARAKLHTWVNGAMNLKEAQG